MTTENAADQKCPCWSFDALITKRDKTEEEVLYLDGTIPRIYQLTGYQFTADRDFLPTAMMLCRRCKRKLAMCLSKRARPPVFYGEQN